ncbi:formate dehydrogenase [Nocardioides terrisoli]|uniref:formate dehydrogenase n=1 Tax=Nocardioides terrisoli TaxID=3388267 RepID=UPI00287B5BE7|nr:formate dehydrogenase [Nocardioides marmorisolisilvae]
MAVSIGWPVLAQWKAGDPLARGKGAKSRRSAELRPRTATADKVVKSICPYCGVGCAQNIYVKDDEIVQIEGDPDSPISRGRLCPKGSATLELATGPARKYQVLHRSPGAADWEEMSLDEAMDRIADLVIATRRDTWQEEHEGRRTHRTMGIASLGGATLDNEENYLIKKLFTSLGIIQVENQARLCHSATVAGLGTSFGRGGSTTAMQDLQNSDCIVIEGSNFAEAHPVGFQWVMEAKARGATLIHVDPRFSRTSALADIHVPIRAGSDIAFLGGIIKYVLDNDLWFHEYVVNYTNATHIVVEEFEDTEDLDGLFSGLHEGEQAYENDNWQLEGVERRSEERPHDQAYRDELAAVKSAGHAESHGSGGAGMRGQPEDDPTLQHPRCVLNLLRRHYARYTPQMVQDVCGIPPDLFEKVCRTITDSSGPERTTAFAYAVGWTQHTTGSQFIKAAGVLQLLLGNIGRPGGGIQALRGHASIQGSTDMATLFNLLPGYLPMPHAYQHGSLDEYIEGERTEKGYWADCRAYAVSLLKAWFGEHAREENDYCFDHLPRITGSHSTYDTTMLQLDGTCKGFFLLGENPAVGSANAKMQRMAMANLDWLVVRDFSLIESATSWKDGPEIDSGELATSDIGTEVFFLPAASHTEKNGTFTNANRHVQWHFAAKEPDGDARSELWFMYHLGRIIREKLAGSADPIDRAVLDLTWDYPVEGSIDEPKAEAVIAEINGYDAKGAPLASYEQLNEDGSTACGAWIYCGVYADGVNQSARRKPATEDNWLGMEWCWVWPANRHILYNRASADPDGKPWSEKKALVWWDEEKALWQGHDIPDFSAAKGPHYRPPAGATRAEALSGIDPFVMQPDGKGWLYVPAGLVDGPMPTHYEPQESPVPNGLYAQQRDPVRQLYAHEHNRYQPSGDDPGADVFPYVATTYRLTEHFTAGGMSRWSAYLSELQPEMFCEVSPELARERGLEHGEWATIVTARNAIEARVMVTPRMAPLRVMGRTVHQVGLPYHWGTNGYSTGDSANDLTAIVCDPNIHIQEVKALTCDIRPGRRPRGKERVEYVLDYQRRAGITPETGMETGMETRR